MAVLSLVFAQQTLSFPTDRNDTLLEKRFGHKRSMFQPICSVAEAFLGSRASLLNSEQHEGPKVDKN